MPCKIGWRGCRLGEVQRNGRAARCGATRISSRAEQEKKGSRDKISQYDIVLIVDQQRNCLPPSISASLAASRFNEAAGQVNPALSGLCAGHCLALVIPIDHSELGRRTPAVSLLHTRTTGNLMHTTDIYLTKAAQSNATAVCEIPTAEDKIPRYCGFSLNIWVAAA